MHGPVDEDDGLLGRADARGRTVGERRGGAPGVGLATDDGEARIADGEAAEGVDGGSVGRAGDVEGVDADDGLVGEVDGAGDERQLRGGHAGAGLQVAPP